MIARINHEHAEREKLEQARQELLKRKQALIAENKKRKDDLANLDQDLERFIDVYCPFWPFCSWAIANVCFRRRNLSRRYSKRNTRVPVTICICCFKIPSMISTLGTALMVYALAI